VPSAFRPEDCHTVRALFTTGSALSCSLQYKLIYPLVPVIWQGLEVWILLNNFVNSPHWVDFSKLVVSWNLNRLWYFEQEHWIFGNNFRVQW
jgi:hypothetical protein